jgi:hypothetical protein
LALVVGPELELVPVLELVPELELVPVLELVPEPVLGPVPGLALALVPVSHRRRLGLPLTE